MASEDIKQVYADAMTAFVNENFASSIELFTRGLKEEPENKMALVSRGAAYLKLNDPERALKDFERAVKVAPNYARAHHLKGLAHEGIGDTESALTSFTRAIEVDPHYGAAYYSRATLFTRLGMENSAFEDIQAVTAITATNLEVYANENNVWHTQHMRVEDALETELMR